MRLFLVGIVLAGLTAGVWEGEFGTVYVADRVVQGRLSNDPDGRSHDAWIGALVEIGQPRLPQHLGRPRDRRQDPHWKVDGAGPVGLPAVVCHKQKPVVARCSGRVSPALFGACQIGRGLGTGTDGVVASCG